MNSSLIPRDRVEKKGDPWTSRRKRDIQRFKHAWMKMSISSVILSWESLGLWLRGGGWVGPWKVLSSWTKKETFWEKHPRVRKNRPTLLIGDRLSLLGKKEIRKRYQGDRQMYKRAIKKPHIHWSDDPTGVTEARGGMEIFSEGTA